MNQSTHFLAGVLNKKTTRLSILNKKNRKKENENDINEEIYEYIYIYIMHGSHFWRWRLKIFNLHKPMIIL